MALVTIKAVDSACMTLIGWPIGTTQVVSLLTRWNLRQAADQNRGWRCVPSGPGTHNFRNGKRQVPAFPAGVGLGRKRHPLNYRTSEAGVLLRAKCQVCETVPVDD